MEEADSAEADVLPSSAAAGGADIPEEAERSESSGRAAVGGSDVRGPPGDATTTPIAALGPPEQVSTEELHRRLLAADPRRARVLHCNDRKRILRSLEVLRTAGVPHSALIEQGLQRSRDEGLRYNPCILWVDCDDATLEQRLRNRAVDMLERGLLDEVRAAYSVSRTHYSTTAGSATRRRPGIIQAIGRSPPTDRQTDRQGSSQ
eukprot:GHVU01127397.1.p1 GENE.GHVU01127397.1~~GHVU01127397.1.p1  ORF type:complete len:205 (+),score=29.87 GHVU01127397.1:748-1362(+)